MLEYQVLKLMCNNKSSDIIVESRSWLAIRSYATYISLGI